VIAASDEEALLEDAQQNAQAFEPAEDAEAPLEADAVDEVVPDGELVVVEFVPDGDTIELDDGRRVRLVQLDAPEGGEDKECYADAARDTLRVLVDQGTEILLVADPLLDQEDRFGRLLRYVIIDGENVNIDLVRRGAATGWFLVGEEGIFATELLEEATLAVETKTGLWGACPDTPFDPRHGADTGPA
jgi:micrococcal nuclease